MPHDDSGASVDAGEPSPPEPVASPPASAEPGPAPLEPTPGRPPPSKAPTRTIIERAPDGILVCRDGRFTYVNPALIELLGYERPDDLIGRPILDIVAPDHRSRMGSLLRAIGDAKGPVSPWEQRWLRRSGASLSVECAGLTIELDGHPSVLMFARDITERKSVEANLQWTERMVAIGTLAAGAAHEINNPIAYILLNLGIISARLDTLKSAFPSAVAADLGRLLRETREGAERVRDIVRDLRMLSRPPNEERLTLVDLKAAIEAAAHMAQHEIKGRARLTQTYEDTFWVEACESRLAQLFLNLLMNAAQAIPESGAEAEHEIRVTVRKGPAGRALVEVSDTGAGIAPSNLDRIFDPFFTTKPVGLGTGLGLAVCHGIVRSIGGDIAVASELGRGTTFRVSLPVKPPPSDAADERASETPRPRPRARILVMDSEPAVAASLSALLSEEHEVVATSSGLEALALLTEPAHRFDVILSDLTMPDLSGAEVFERIRSARPEFADRFIFMSGGVVTPRSLEFLVKARSAHLEKPFTPARLLALISAIAARR